MEKKQMGSGRGKFRKILLVCALVLVLLTGAVYFGIFHLNRFRLEIHLIGEAEQRLEYGETYEESGAELWIYGSMFLKEGILLEKPEIRIDGSVSESELGRQEIRYSAQLNRLTAEAVRSVHVLDTKPPVLILKDMEQEYVPGETFVEPGYEAVDDHDGDLTDRVVRTEKEGKLLYAVTDLSGNPVVATRSVPGFDPQPPVITLEGGEDYRIQVGTVYEEPGYYASDSLDGELTDLVTVEGEADWLQPGIYPITYRVSDSGGNETVLVRNVTVEAAVWPDTEYPRNKTIYLTFDDGPGIHTRQLLDVLDAYGAKATFFVVNSGYDDLMKEIVRRGHSIGIHSVSHNYEEIYASPEAFFADLYGMQEIIYQNTGVRTTLMRFPGGSSNSISRRYSPGIMTTLTRAVQDAGFQYFDWNVSSGDAGETTKTEEVYNFVINGVQNHRVSIVLQHDIHYYSVAAVEKILQWGRRNGYRFSALEENSPGFHQDLLN